LFHKGRNGNEKTGVNAQADKRASGGKGGDWALCVRRRRRTFSGQGRKDQGHGAKIVRRTFVNQETYYAREPTAALVRCDGLLYLSGFYFARNRALGVYSHQRTKQILFTPSRNSHTCTMTRDHLLSRLAQIRPSSA